jgi:glucose-6-phosphate isomerase
VWGINPFDQWGVELGKQLATRFGDLLAGAGADVDRSEPSSELVRRYRELRDRD